MATIELAHTSRRREILHITSIILVIILSSGLAILLTLLAIDVFTIPYLTPFAHFLALILAPFIPFLAPLTLTAFLRICRHESFPSKKYWACITGVWVVNHIQRVSKDTATLYLGRGAEGEVELCGLMECKGAWVQSLLIAGVVLGELVGLKWEFGLVDLWVEGIVKGATAQEEKKRREALGSDVEKAVDVKEVVIEEEVVGGDMEKTALLVEVEEK